MNLDKFLNDVYGTPLKEQQESSPEEINRETEKFIKNLKKVRFNMMFKNIGRINQFMVDLGATVRGVVKSTILKGAMDLFKQSRERSQQYRKQKDEMLTKYAEKFVEKLDVEKSLSEFVEDAEFERITFEKEMDQISDTMMAGISNNDQLTFFMTQFLKTDMLESPEERKYHDRAIEITEYFVVQTMQLRIIFSCIQTVISRIVSKIKLSKAADAEKKAAEAGKILIKFFRLYVENKYGNAIGQYLSTYVEDYYHSTNDRKEQFIKFENLINVLLGVRGA